MSRHVSVKTATDVGDTVENIMAMTIAKTPSFDIPIIGILTLLFLFVVTET